LLQLKHHTETVMSIGLQNPMKLSGNLKALNFNSQTQNSIFYKHITVIQPLSRPALRMTMYLMLSVPTILF